MNSIPILYQDDQYIVVHKPSGMLVHRTSIDNDEKTFLIQILRDQLEQQVHPCHRLDKATSGLIMLAFNKDALRKANDLFAKGQIQKTYQALVRGWVLNNAIIDYLLRLESLYKKKQKQKNTLQNAITSYTPLERFEIDLPLGRYPTARFTHCKLQPQTGRRHQLRRHLAHLRHPIIGDTTHGDGLQNRFARTYLNTNRLFLAATSLRFVHPYTHKETTISCPPDPSFLNPITKIIIPNLTHQTTKLV